MTMNNAAPSAPRKVACILAGSRGTADPVAALQDKPLKAFVEIGGKAMIDRVLSAVNACALFDQILICIPEMPAEDYPPLMTEMLENGAAALITPAQSPAASVLKVIEAIPDDAELLITTADHPLLQAHMIESFVAQINSTAHASVAMVPLSLIQGQYPQSRRTRLRFKNGAFSGCNLFMFKNEGTYELIKYWQKLENQRKKPLQMALTIGPQALIGYVLNALNLETMLKLIGRKTKTTIEVVMLNDAEAGIDVDKIEDYELVKTILNTQAL